MFLRAIINTTFIIGAITTVGCSILVSDELNRKPGEESETPQDADTDGANSDGADSDGAASDGADIDVPDEPMKMDGAEIVGSDEISSPDTHDDPTDTAFKLASNNKQSSLHANERHQIQRRLSRSKLPPRSSVPRQRTCSWVTQIRL